MIMKDRFFKPTAVLCTHCEQIAGAGEDGFAYSFENDNVGYIAAFDGCGGMGAKKYKNAGNKSGAKIASALAGLVVDRFYYDHGFVFDNKDSQRLCSAFSAAFKSSNSKISSPCDLKIGGNLFRSIPTTASIVAISTVADKKLRCEFIWAGDSRGYILDKKGLCQITLDDLETQEDAFSNLRSDSKLSNVINADIDFYLHEKVVDFDDPVMVITATDGSFGYFSTPMEFEYVVLRSLCDSKSSDEWHKRLEKMISPYTGDDFTVIAAIYGLDRFENCKIYFEKRLNYLYNRYIKHISNASEKVLYDLWNDYKKDYYRR